MSKYNNVPRAYGDDPITYFTLQSNKIDFFNKNVNIVLYIRRNTPIGDDIRTEET